MLPFDREPWAKKVAKSVIVGTLIAEVVAILWLRYFGPLDTAEVVALILILIGVLPPNIHIIRRKQGAFPQGAATMSEAPLTSRK